MTKYKVTERVVNLVQDLMLKGYDCTAELTNGGCTGTQEHLEGAFAIQLTGFCKETLHISEAEEGNIVFIGRYSLLRCEPDASVQDVVSCAWGLYQKYKVRDYSMPSEFKDLFKEFGFIQKRIRTVTDWVEKGEAT